MDYRALLIKYVAHVVMAEGETFAPCHPGSNPSRLSPCDCGEYEFTDAEKAALIGDIFPEVQRWASQSA